MSTSVGVTIGILLVLAYILSPVTLIWGWIRWRTNPRSWSVPSSLSFIGFTLASASALLALTTIAIAQVHHFGFYDPSLIKIYVIGLLLSTGALICGLAGVWRSSVLQWHAPLSAIGMLAFWLIATAGE